MDGTNSGVSKGPGENEDQLCKVQSEPVASTYSLSKNQETNRNRKVQ